MGSMKDLLGDQPYPLSPGYKENTTSKDAAKVVANESSALREACLREIAQSSGLTADEVASRLKRSVLSIRPRLSELRKMKTIEPTGERRKNESGMSASVWRGTPNSVGWKS